MDRSSRWKISKETQALNDILDQTNFNVCRAFHPEVAEYTLFSRAHRTSSSMNHMQGHKARPDKFKKTEIISSIFSDHNTKRLVSTTGKKLLKKPHKHMETKQCTSKQ